MKCRKCGVLTFGPVCASCKNEACGTNRTSKSKNEACGTNRTSKTHPIQVDWLKCEGLGITFAPGKHGTSSYGAPWRRDLVTDVERLRHVHKVDVLVSLIEEHELVSLKITRLVEVARAAGIDIWRFPVPNTKPPEDMLELRGIVVRAQHALSKGKRVVVHCRGGLGRAGTVAGCILRAQGLSGPAALDALRDRHATDCPENDEQRLFVSTFEQAPAAPNTIRGWIEQFDKRRSQPSPPGVRKQPAPIPNSGVALWDLVIEDTQSHAPADVVRLVIADMRARDEFGLNHYGTRLCTGNGRDMLIDAYHEALDLCVYLRDTDHVGIYRRALEIAYDMRRKIEDRG